MYRLLLLLLLVVLLLLINQASRCSVPGLISLSGKLPPASYLCKYMVFFLLPLDLVHCPSFPSCPDRLCWLAPSSISSIYNGASRGGKARNPGQTIRHSLTNHNYFHLESSLILYPHTSLSVSQSSHWTHCTVISHLIFSPSLIPLTGLIQCCVDMVTDLHDQLHPSIVNIPLTNLLLAINFTQEQRGFNRALCNSIGQLINRGWARAQSW